MPFSLKSKHHPAHVTGNVLKEECRLCLIALALSLFSCSLGAQPFLDVQDQRSRSDFGLIYAIKPEQAINILSKSKKNDRAGRQKDNKSSTEEARRLAFEALADSLIGQQPTDSFHGLRPTRFVRPGAYIALRAEGEYLEMELLNFHTFSSHIRPNPEALELVVYDSLAQIIPTARVTLDGIPLRYDAGKQSYRLEKCKKGGVLVVEAEGEVQVELLGEHFSEAVSFKKRKQQYRRAYGTGRYFAKPIYWGQLMRHFIRYPSFRQLKYQLKHNRNQRFLHKTRQKKFNGYVIFNQPLYLPGDTLKVKAYIANAKGKPRRKAVQFHVLGNGRQYFKRRLKPDSPGSFVFETVLRDSLTLDQHYFVQFYAEDFPKRYRDGYDYSELGWFLEGNFRYEDYQLDVVQYNISPLQPTYTSTESVILKLEALDANKQPVPAVSVHLVLQGNAERQHATQVMLADTIWQLRQPLSGDRHTLISVPASCWPDADLVVTAMAHFINSGGEIQTRTCQFQVRKKLPAPSTATLLPKLELLTHNGQEVKVFWSNPAQGTPDTALLYLEYAGGMTVQRRIKLPYTAQLPRSISNIKVISGMSERSNNLWSSPINLTLERIEDSVVCMLDNPERITARYELKADGKVIQEGILQDTHWQWIRVGTAETAHAYSMNCYFMINGRDYSLNEELPFFANELKISLRQPELTRPGATAQVEIAVYDAKNRPVPHVELSTVAINAQYGNQLPFETPEITYKQHKPPFQYGSFYFNTRKTSGTKAAVGLWRHTKPTYWFEQLGLDSMLYYRIRFKPLGNQAYILRRSYPPSDSIDYRQPQFSPFLIQAGKAIPIHLIYCNRRLVYSSLSTDNPPYSFFGQKGSNEIEVRTANGKYTIRGLELDFGEKVELSIDVNDNASWSRKLSTANAGDNLDIYRNAMPDSLTTHEQKLLREHMLLWMSNLSQGQSAYFWQKRHNIHMVQAYKSKLQVIGPFQPESEDVNFLKRHDFYSKFRFDPGFVYELMPGRERLYSNSWPARLGKLSNLAPLQFPGMLAHQPNCIDWGKGERKSTYSLKNFAQSNTFALGRAKLKLNLTVPTDSPLLTLVLKFRDKLLGPFPGGTRHFTGLPPGDAELLLYNQQMQVCKTALLLRSDSTLHLRLDKLDFSAPPPAFQLPRLFPVDSIQVEKKSDLSSNFSQWPGSLAHNEAIQGRVMDENGELLIGASIKLMQGAVFLQSATADVEGRFKLNAPTGVYDLYVNYTGYKGKRVEGIWVNGIFSDFLEITLEAGDLLQEVVITGLAVSSVSRDNITSAKVSIVAAAPVADVEEKRKLEVQATQKQLPEAALVQDPRIRKNFRDNAWWKPQLRTDKQGKAAFQVTFPDNITAWNSHALGMDNKLRAGVGSATTLSYLPLSAQLYLPRFAVAGDQFDVNGLATNLEKDSLPVTTVFYQGDSIIRQRQLKIGPGWSEYAPVAAPLQGDSLYLRFELRSEKSSDAEQRCIALNPVGMEETHGKLWYVERDTELVFLPEAGQGPVVLHVENNILDMLFEDVKYLHHYPFGCNEQTSSRLIALLLAKEIARYRPDKTIAGLDKEINKCVKRLSQTQHFSGSWGWWAESDYDEWMTRYVIRALYQAQLAGFTTPALNRGLTWLRSKLDGFNSTNLTEALLLLREAGVDVDCTPYLSKLDQLQPQSLQERLARLRLRQYCALGISKDSLMQCMQRNTQGAMYCGEENYSWGNRRAVNTLLAFDIAAAAQWNDITYGIRRYWLFSRGLKQANTIETAQYLLRLLPFYLKQGNVNSGLHSEFHINGTPQTALPRHLTLPSDQPLRLRVKGEWPLYITAYQRRFNPDPLKTDSLFALNSTLYQRGKPIADSDLLRGEPLQLRVQFEAKRNADYVMVEIPIPAGCSYGLKTQPGYNNIETHREYYRDKTLVFYKRVLKGIHTIEINLEPRFPGHFTLNPARAEQMYFPIFGGNDTVRKVRIRG